MSSPAPGQTFFAPAKRASPAEVGKAAAIISGVKLVQSMLHAYPGWALVLNEERQVVAANDVILESLGASSLEHVLGRRAGELIGCLNAKCAPSGCGTGEPCRFCGAAAMVEALETQTVVTRECRVPLDLEHGAALDLQVVVTPVFVDDRPLLLVTMRDVGPDNRRRVLERAFSHDLLNAASGVFGIARLMDDGIEQEREGEFKELLVVAAEQVTEEICSFQSLRAAELGELEPVPQPVSVQDLLEGVHAAYAAHAESVSCSLRLGPVPEIELISDRTLARRVLANLVKNAVEATGTGGEVRIWAEDLYDDVLFAVHNPGVMSKEVSVQLFQRSFSTKGTGRGIGTFSVKLLGEGYLGGKVAFATSAERGTTFTWRVPKRWWNPNRARCGTPTP